MSLNETITNLGDSIINLVDKKTHRGLMALDYGEVEYDKEVWRDINKYKHSTFDENKFTKVGTPHVTDDGIYTEGTGYVSYFKLGNSLSGSVDLYFKITTSDDIGYQVVAGKQDRIFSLAIRDDNKIGFAIGTWNEYKAETSESTYTVQANTTYYLHFSFDGTNTYQLKVSTDDENWTTAQTYVDPDNNAYLASSNPAFIGNKPGFGGGEQAIFKGTIDMTYYKLYNNSSLIEDWSSLSQDRRVIALDITNNNGVLSNFYYKKYLSVTFQTPTTSFRVVCKCKHTNIATIYGDNWSGVSFNMYRGVYLRNADAWSEFNFGSGSLHTNSIDIPGGLEQDKWYIIDSYYEGAKNTVKIYDENYNLLVEKEITVGENIYMNYSSFSIKGIHDLKYFSLEINGVEVFNGNKTGIDILKKNDFGRYYSPVIDESNIYYGQKNSSRIEKHNLPNIKAQVITLKQSGTFGTASSSAQCLFRLISLYPEEQQAGESYAPDVSFTVYFNKNKQLSGEIGFGSDNQGSIKTYFQDSPALPNNSKYSFVITIDVKNKTVSYLLWVNDNLFHKSSVRSFTYDMENRFKWGNYYIVVGSISSWNTNVGTNINLNSTQVYFDGKLVWQPCLRIPYTETKAGYKVAPYEWRPCLEQLKEEKGFAPYYTADDGEKENFHRIGSPTITNKILSDCSASSYLKYRLVFPEDIHELIMETEYIAPTAPPETNGFDLVIRQLNIGLGAICNENNFKLIAGILGYSYFRYGMVDLPYDGEKYMIKTVANYDTRKYQCFAKKSSDSEWSYVNSPESFPAAFNPSANLIEVSLGNWGGSVPYFLDKGGSADLSKTKIYINGKLVWTPYIKPSYTLPMGDVYGVLSAKANSSDIAMYGMPSETFESLTLGEPETTYISPANGWFVFSKVAGAADKYIQLRNLSNNMREDSKGTHAEDVLSVYLPVKKGDSVMADYNATGDLWQFGFIYAEGEI